MEDEKEIFRRLREMERAQSTLPTIEANELLDKQFPARPELVDGFLRPGTYLMVGAPKVGKSFLMAQLCCCVAGGRPFLNAETRAATVLYLALEDTESRMQERLVRMFGADDLNNLHLAFQIRAPDHLLEELERFCQTHPNTHLVVIDTLQMVRQADGVEYSYRNDYKAIQAFKAFTDRHHLSLLLVHHTRKNQSDEDPFNMISGTNGLLGAADGAYVLYRSKTEGNATLDFTGRDLPRSRLTLHFDPGSCLWQLIRREDAFELPPEPLLEVLPQIIGDSWLGTATQLSDLLRAREPPIDIAPNALTRKLNSLTTRLEQEAGYIYRGKRSANTREVSFRRILVDSDDDNDGLSATLGEPS